MSEIEVKVRREVLDDIIVREIEAKDEEIRRLKAELAEHKDVMRAAHIAMGDVQFKKAFFILDAWLKERQ